MTLLDIEREVRVALPQAQQRHVAAWSAAEALRVRKLRRGIPNGKYSSAELSRILSAQ